MRMVRALESVVVTRFIQSAIWMGGSSVGCSRGMVGFIFVVLCIAGRMCFSVDSMYGLDPS